MGMFTEHDDLQTQLACACDLVNTWCRETGLAEVKNPYRDLGLREGIDRLWSRLSSDVSALRKENDRLLQAVEELSAEAERLRKLLGKEAEDAGSQSEA